MPDIARSGSDEAIQRKIFAWIASHGRDDYRYVTEKGTIVNISVTNLGRPLRALYYAEPWPPLCKFEPGYWHVVPLTT